LVINTVITAVQITFTTIKMCSEMTNSRKIACEMKSCINFNVIFYLGTNYRNIYEKQLSNKKTV